MVDGTGQEAVRCEDRERGQAESDMLPPRAAHSAPGETHEAQERHHQQKRPDRQRPGFGALGADEEAEDRDQIGDRQIDEARPVHQRTAGKAKAVLRHVEPALASQQIANFDEAHGVVIVGTDIVRRVAIEEEQRDDDEGAVDESDDPGVRPDRGALLLKTRSLGHSHYVRHVVVPRSSQCEAKIVFRPQQSVKAVADRDFIGSY